MGWWFGRKDAPADGRPFVPSWLSAELAVAGGGEGFARSVDGLAALVRSNRLRAEYGGGSWEVGVARAARVEIGGTQVLGAQAPAIASPSGGTTVDAESRAAIGQLLTMLRGHGLIAG